MPNGNSNGIRDLYRWWDSDPETAADDPGRGEGLYKCVRQDPPKYVKRKEPKNGRPRGS